MLGKVIEAERKGDVRCISSESEKNGELSSQPSREGYRKKETTGDC